MTYERLAEIQARCEKDKSIVMMTGIKFGMKTISQAFVDRADLLAEVKRLRERCAGLEAALLPSLSHPAPGVTVADVVAVETGLSLSEVRAKAWEEAAKMTYCMASQLPNAEDCGSCVECMAAARLQGRAEAERRGKP